MGQRTDLPAVWRELREHPHAQQARLRAQRRRSPLPCASPKPPFGPPYKSPRKGERRHSRLPLSQQLVYDLEVESVPQSPAPLRRRQPEVSSMELHNHRPRIHLYGHDAWGQVGPVSCTRSTSSLKGSSVRSSGKPASTHQRPSAADPPIIQLSHVTQEFLTPCRLHPWHSRPWASRRYIRPFRCCWGEIDTELSVGKEEQCPV